MNHDLNDIVKLAKDVYTGSVESYSVKEAEQALRNALIEVNGGSDKIDYRAIRENGAKIFTVTEVILENLLVEGLEQQFDPFVEIRNVNLGDKNAFMVDDYHLFKVATIAAGTNDIRRQRLDRSAFYVDTAWKGIKIYDELERFLTGRFDWAKTVAKVQRSFNAQIESDIYSAIQTGYNALQSPYKATGSFDLTQFNTLVEHLKSSMNVDNVTVFGTRLALQKAAPQYIAYNGQVIADRNNDGFFRVIDGIPFVEIKQSHTPGTDNFAVSDNFLLVIPNNNEKIVKLVLEGDPLIRQTDTSGMNADDSVEYLFKKKYGVGVLTTGHFGAYVFS